MTSIGLWIWGFFPVTWLSLAFKSQKDEWQCKQATPRRRRDTDRRAHVQGSSLRSSMLAGKLNVRTSN